MKTITRTVLAVGIAASLWSCGTKEREQLQSKVDSLNVELVASRKVESSMVEIGALIDSIDVNRKLLSTKMVEGTTYNDYSTRLKEINKHIKDTEAKIGEMEKSIKKSSGMASTIKRLKNDLELRSQQITALQTDVERMQNENKVLSTAGIQKDSIITVKTQEVELREQDVASLKGLVEDINTQSQATKANLYYSNAEALEQAADRTKFAPKKKKETKREALELYKLSFSLGKKEALSKINQLEKDLG